MVGKYVDLVDAYKSVNEALAHAGLANAAVVDIVYLDSISVERNPEASLAGVDAVLVPGGFGERGVEGKIAAARYARENRIPYFGICLGMQVAAIEFARNRAGLPAAHSTEFVADARDPVIALVTEWREADGALQTRSHDDDLGATMRLGEQRCILTAGSRAAECYGTTEIFERHRHRFEFNNRYRHLLADAGLVFSGVSAEDDLVEVIELPDHPWFIGCQFHPEFTSTPRLGHPLFNGFIAAAREHKTA
jgi:CTP synthase